MVLANGINRGLTRMADTCESATRHQLAHLYDCHVSESGYGAGLTQSIDANRALPPNGRWGDGTTSSSDGHLFPAGGRCTSIGNINAYYGNEPGVSFHTHISDQYDPFASPLRRADASAEGCDANTRLNM